MDDQSFDKNVANENGINSMNVLLCLQAMLLLLLIKQSIRKKEIPLRKGQIPT